MSKENVSCAVVIALKEEFKTISEYLEVELKPTGPDESSFFKFSFLDQTGNLRTGVVTLIGDMGPTKANAQTQLLLEHWKPNLLLNIGIAGALDSDLRIGDVAVATVVDEYLSKARAVPSADLKGFDFEFAGDARPCSEPLVRLVDRLELTRQKEFKTKFAAKSRMFASRLLQGDVLSSLQSQELVREAASIFVGPIASGPIVGAAIQFISLLKKRNRKFIALEMEAAGFMNAADMQPAIPRLVLRGISDLSDDTKEAIEKSSKGALRRLAMANVLTLTKLLLEYFPDYERPGLRSSQQRSFRELAETLHDQALKKFLGGVYWNQLVRTPSEEVGKLFGLISAIDGLTLAPETILPQLISRIAASRHPCPLRIKGAVGTGKTLLLQAIYQHHWQAFSSASGNCIPILIDMKYYDDQAFLNPEDLIRQFQTDILPLNELLARFPEQQIILFIDSIDHHAVHREKLELEIVRLLSRRNTVRRVVAVGLDRSLSAKRSIHKALNDSESTCYLSQFKKSDGGLQVFMESVAVLREDNNQEKRRQANRWVQVFGLTEIDFITASIIFEKANASSFEQVESLADFYELFCTDYLQENRTDEVDEINLEKASAVAHAHIIQRLPIENSNPSLWNLIYYHPSIQYFLIARHVISQLRKCESLAGTSDSVLDTLNFVYPQPIDKFCKEIMSRDLETEMACINGAKKIMEGLVGKQLWKYLKVGTHICYLLGRVKTNEARAQALEILQSHLENGQKLWRKMEGRINQHAKIKGFLLYERTIFISLAYLGDQDASKNYLYRLLTDRNSDMLNRGFHLEYYQDIPYIPDADQMVHQDDLRDFPNTYKALKTRVERFVSGAKSELFEIELYTILSLAQNRHAAGKLDEKLRDDVRTLSTKALRHIRNAELKAYMSMMNKILVAPAFPIGSVLERIYHLKIEKRKGWIKRGVQDGESVSDHTLGCLILAKIFLPEEVPSASREWKGYDKGQVMKYLFIHDFAEAFTGDLLPHERDEKARAEEAEWFSYLGMLSTFQGLHGLRSIKSDWDDFEARTSINGKIAGDLDKLENLAQLYIYERQGKNVENPEKFKEDLIKEITTEAGQHILSILKEWFESNLPLVP